MYDYIKGQVTRVTPEYVVVEQQGIGYQTIYAKSVCFSEKVKKSFKCIHIFMCEKMRIS